MYFFFLMIRPPPRSTRTDTLFPYTTLFRSAQLGGVEGIAFDKLELAADHPVERAHVALDIDALDEDLGAFLDVVDDVDGQVVAVALDARRSEEHASEIQSLMRISYAVFCLKKKTKTMIHTQQPQNQSMT